MLLKQTRIRFPRFDGVTVKIEPIEKGGSDRRFYRVLCSPEQTLILVKYNLERQENRHYVAIAEFLAEHGIRAPKIYFHDAAEGLIWIEDLGATDLWSHRQESWLVRRAFYEAAIDEIVKLHSLPAAIGEAIQESLPAPFESALYRWEQDYFFENCLGRHFEMAKTTLSKLAKLPILHEIAERLGKQSRVLIHRDFQSQNIMMRNMQAHLIDFQGMRFGLAEYDVASLLFDPYVALPEIERDELLALYEQKRKAAGHAVSADFRENYQFCAIQRLMQALGAYGFIGLVKGHRAFLEHIPAAMRSLHGLIEEVDGLEALAEVLDCNGKHSATPL